MKIGNWEDWNIDRSDSSKIRRGDNGWVESDVGAEVGICDSEEV